MELEVTEILTLIPPHSHQRMQEPLANGRNTLCSYRDYGVKANQYLAGL
jgi:hypothetical protein